MKIAFFDTHEFERYYFDIANKSFNHEITYFDARLTRQTAGLANGFDVICCFVNDHLDSETLEYLKSENLKIIALRSAGFNNVDVNAAKALSLPVVRVPSYSPHSVAEHAVGLLLNVNRKIHKAYSRVRELNFSLEGLVGFDVNGKTVGVIGTGQIGSVFAGIMKGFGCRVLAYDTNPDDTLEKEKVVEYVELETLYKQSDIISLHVPLSPETHHMIDPEALNLMKKGVILINTSRGALINSSALMKALKQDHLGAAALDVYEEEENVFFQDLSTQGLHDDILARLITFPNVIITSHQGFLTKEALENIAQTTLENVSSFERGEKLINQLEV